MSISKVFIDLFKICFELFQVILLPQIWSSSPTEIIFYELLHVLSFVEHPQLAADVWAGVELPDESVDVIPHNVYHSEQI